MPTYVAAPEPRTASAGGTFFAMSEDRSSGPEREHAPADDPLAGLRKLAGLAKELGVTDVASFTEMLEAARNEGRGAEVFKPLKDLVEQYGSPKASTKSASDLGTRLMGLVSGRESAGDRQQRTETALLRRIEELSSTASIEGVLDLATAYARLCSAGADQGDRTADERRAGGQTRKDKQ